MNKKQQLALKNLLNMYSELYSQKKLFNDNLFFGTPEEISQIFSSELLCTAPSVNPRTSIIRHDVQELKTIEQVREFISKLELLDGTYESLTENKAAIELTIADYKYIYSVLYQTPITGKIKKETLINYIVKYFKGIDRAQSLKP